MDAGNAVIAEVDTFIIARGAVGWAGSRSSLRSRRSTVSRLRPAENPTPTAAGRHVDRRCRRPGGAAGGDRRGGDPVPDGGLEGSRAYTLVGRLSLRPSVEVGLRHDGGDAEPGAGWMSAPGW